MARIAAIDFGLKRIGIALSDINQKLALPFETVEGGEKAISNVIAALAKKKGEIEKILVGLPLLLSGKKGDMAIAAEKFAKELQIAIDIPVELWDERFSSKIADRSMKELSIHRKKRARQMDTASAALLLQSYLDKNAISRYR
ncbi:MAG TPA: Holliday junction resolvase RuvX [Chlamydiales bacterium]|nr:Holliday junction resolvase RuvX [Chlamydiales bacterium]